MSRSPPHSPAQALTPESLLPRSDSRNAAATCRGLTGVGRPCRRSIATAIERASRFIAVGEDEDASLLDPAVFYCWQHKGQASPVATFPADVARRKLEQVSEKQRRTSLDTLVDRLGVMDLSTRESYENRRRKEGRKRQVPPLKKTKSRPGFREGLCCFIIPKEDLDDRYEIVRHRQRRPDRSWEQEKSHYQQQSQLTHPLPASARRRAPVSSVDLVPKTIAPQTAALLHAETARPISPHDEEGYIYMFWLTENTIGTPSEADITSLLGSPNTTRPSISRRTSEVLQHYGTVRSSGRRQSTERKTVLLKIGRANNVHRRLAEWTRQCGYNLSLLRFYPYVSATPRESTRSVETTMNQQLMYREVVPVGIRKVPFVHRVEKLIHIELRDQRVDQDACSACGCKHREWFEVPARREDIARVDAVVKKWVTWAESMAARQ